MTTNARGTPVKDKITTADSLFAVVKSHYAVSARHAVDNGNMSTPPLVWIRTGLTSLRLEETSAAEAQNRKDITMVLVCVARLLGCKLRSGLKKQKPCFNDLFRFVVDLKI